MSGGAVENDVATSHAGHARTRYRGARHSFYACMALLSGIGFLASVACHVWGWTGIEPPGGQLAFMLHVGIFVVWIPMVISANRTMPKGARGNMEHLLAVLPRWAKRVAGCGVAYVVFNFVYFIYSTQGFPKGKVPLVLELRGFSGHWMLFYGIAMVSFWGLARIEHRKRQAQRTFLCAQCGGAFPPGTVAGSDGLGLCTRCGYVGVATEESRGVHGKAFRLACPTCGKALGAEKINVQTDAAVCEGCQIAYRVRELVADAGARGEALKALPKGVRYRETPDGWELEVSCRSVGSLFILGVAVLCTSALAGGTTAMWRSGAICCFPVLFLFYWAGYTMWWFALMSVAGRVTLRVAGGDAELVNGRCWWARRQRFRWSNCRGVGEAKGEGMDVTVKGLHFQAGTGMLVWGQAIPEKRRKAVGRIVWEHVAYQGMRVRLDGSEK